MEPLDNLGDKAKDMTLRIFKIMAKPEELDSEDMMYLVNNASPMVELLKNAMHHRLVTLGVDEDESMAILTTLSQMSVIAGGISFADFSITEKMAKDLAE